MRVLREGGLSTPTQGARLRVCIELMRFALHRERPNVGDEAVEVDRSDRSGNGLNESGKYPGLLNVERMEFMIMFPKVSSRNSSEAPKPMLMI